MCLRIFHNCVFSYRFLTSDPYLPDGNVCLCDSKSCSQKMAKWVSLNLWADDDSSNCQRCLQTHMSMIAKRKGSSHLPENKLSCRNTTGGTERKDGWRDEDGVRGRRSSHLRAERKPVRCRNPSLSVWGDETVLISIYDPLHCLFPSVWWDFIRDGRILIQVFLVAW